MRSRHSCILHSTANPPGWGSVPLHGQVCGTDTAGGFAAWRLNPPYFTTQFINPMILKEPPNRTATPNCHSRASGNPVLTRGIWIPACAGMTIYSRCVDTHARREKGVWSLSRRGERSEGGEAGWGEGVFS